MKKLLTIAALTLLTSTAWANNAEGDSYTGEGSHLNIEHPPLSQKAHNTASDSYTGEGSYLNIKPAHPTQDAQATIHKHVGAMEQRGDNEDSGA